MGSKWGVTGTAVWVQIRAGQSCGGPGGTQWWPDFTMGHRLPCSPTLVSSVCAVALLCPTLCNPVDCSPPGASVHGILQARVLEWVAIAFSTGSSPPRDGTRVSCVPCAGRQILYHCATREAQLLVKAAGVHGNGSP